MVFHERLLINSYRHQSEKNCLNYLAQEESRALSACWLFTVTENLLDRTPRPYGVWDTSHAIQESKTHTNSLPSSHREKNIYSFYPILSSHSQRSRTHHAGAEQISVLCILPTALYHFHCFRAIGWMWVYLEVKSCICGRKKKVLLKPCKQLQNF